jgi:hypothetical protein
MGAGKLRVLAGRGVVAVGVAVLASACSQASSSSAGGPATPTAPATPTVVPSTVPVLGKLTFGTFPSTWDGTHALMLCEQWSGLRGEYVSRVQAGTTPYRLEQWFSSDEWGAAFSDSAPLVVDPAYVNISTAFGLATAGEVASIANARFLDKSCAAAD